jgi:cytoskeletal protein CcmA (bactofilin family)
MSAAPSFGIESSTAKASLGKSVVVKGHLLSGEDLTIDGEVEGTIEVLEHRLTIAATGRVRADVNARDIEIWGCIEGKLEAVNQVHIRKGARFVGEIHAAGLVIEEGGYIRGSIDLSRHSAHSHPAPEDGSSMDSHRNISKMEPIRQPSEAILRS